MITPQQDILQVGPEKATEKTPFKLSSNKVWRQHYINGNDSKSLNMNHV